MSTFLLLNRGHNSHKIFMKIHLKLTEKLNLNFIFLNPYLYFFNRKKLHINARLHINFSSKVKALERQR